MVQYYLHSTQEKRQYLQRGQLDSLLRDRNNIKIYIYSFYQKSLLYKIPLAKRTFCLYSLAFH